MSFRTILLTRHFISEAIFTRIACLIGPGQLAHRIWRPTLPQAFPPSITCHEALSVVSTSFLRGIFSLLELAFLTSRVVILVAYFTYSVPSLDFDVAGGRHRWGRSTNHSVSTASISWTMKQAQDAPASFTGCFMRSVSFRSTICARYLSIPENGAAFVNFFLIDIHQWWLNLVSKSRLYISHNVSHSMFICP